MNLLLGALPGNLFLGTLSWEPVLGNFACLLQTCSLEIDREPVLRNFAWEPCLGTCPSEPCLGFCSCFQPCLQMFRCSSKFRFASCSWKAVPGNMSNLKPCLGTCSWEPCWQPIARNLPREFVLETRTCSWEPVLRTLAWEPVLAKLACKPVLGNLAWGPVCGNLAWEPVPKDLAW